MLKKTLAIICALLLCTAAFCSCADSEKSTDKLQIVCTLFPYYDWARNITKGDENVELTLLLDSGTDLHSYQPTAADIVKITSADIFIYTGGESDRWVTEVLGTSGNNSLTVLNLMTALGEEHLCHEEEIGEEEHEHEDEDHEHTYDEHIWLSLKNASLGCEEICKALCQANADNKDTYESNLSEYKASLSSLQEKYEDCVSKAATDTIVVADRFPFVYLVNDLGLKYSAAFSGCSAESEASFATVKRLADETDALKLKYIIVTETSDQSVANTVKNTTESKDQEILTLNSLQSITKDKLDSSYCEIMEGNLSVLATALS